MRLEELDKLFWAVKEEHQENLKWMKEMNNYNLDDVFRDTEHSDVVAELVRYIIEEYK